jgi:hypothetical protein
VSGGFALPPAGSSAANFSTVKADEEAVSNAISAEIVAISVAVGTEGAFAIGVGNLHSSFANSVTTQLSASASGAGAPSLTAKGDLSILSLNSDSLTQNQAIAVTGSGGISFAVSGATNVAEGSSSSTSQTLLDAGTLQASGDVTLAADAVNNLTAASYGGAGSAAGTFAAGFGVMVATTSLGNASSDPEVWLRLGNDSTALSVNGANVTLRSSSTDTLTADSVSAALGASSVALAGAGAISTTTTSQTAKTQLGSNSTVSASAATGTISLASALTQAIDSRGEGIAVAAAFIGAAASGVGLSNTITSSGTIAIGDGAQIVAPNLSLEATYNLSKNKYGSQNGDSSFTQDFNANSVAVGTLGGSGIGSTTTIGSGDSQAGSFISIGQNALLEANGSLSQPGSLQLQALNAIVATDYCLLDATLSAVSVVNGISTIANNAQTGITVASGAQLINPSGAVQIAAKGDGTISASSSAMAGLFGGGTSKTTATNTPNNNISLDGATLQGVDVQIWSRCRK